MGAHLEELHEAIGWIVGVKKHEKSLKIILEGPPIKKCVNPKEYFKNSKFDSS